MIINSDSLHALKELDENSIDAVITDPPYGYSFMGKDWDKAVPSVEIWQECLRVLKPGGWCMVMSAPRSDVQNAMISRLMEAGFRLDFTPIYWTYASGFPKAGNVGKLVDKRLGAEREIKGYESKHINRPQTDNWKKSALEIKNGIFTSADGGGLQAVTEPATDQAKALDGSYTGFQPKPAVEVVIVAMKPLSEKTYVDQALKNGKGITWLDDCRVPLNGEKKTSGGGKTRADNTSHMSFRGGQVNKEDNTVGRFPANLLVSDDVLNDGMERKSPKPYARASDASGGILGKPKPEGMIMPGIGDSGSYSRYFDLDKWAAAHLSEQQMKTFPFAIVPKASKSEKNKGLNKSVSIDIIGVCNDNGLTVEEKLVQLQVTTDNSRLKATAVYGTQNRNATEWSMSWFGSEYTEKYLTDTKSTTSTTISSTMTSQICDLLERYFTSEYTADVSYGTENGGSPAESATNSNTLIITMNEKMASALGANGAKLPTQLRISVKDGRNVHPTCKPLKLMSYLITLTTREGDVVLDPFVGSGTTVVAAKQLNRKGIGIEREPEYAEIARARVEANRPEPQLSLEVED